MSKIVWSRSILISIFAMPSCVDGVSGGATEGSTEDSLEADESVDISAEASHDASAGIGRAPASSPEENTTTLQCRLSTILFGDLSADWILDCRDAKALTPYDDELNAEGDLLFPSAVSGSGGGRVLHVRR